MSGPHAEGLLDIRGFIGFNVCRHALFIRSAHLRHSPHRAGGLLTLYITVGVLYNYLVLDLRGLDVIPRYSLFTMQDAIKVFRACFARVLGRTAGAFHSGNGRAGMHGGYSGLSGARDEEEGMLSGPTGFLYEDEEEEDEPELSTPAAQPQGANSNGVIRL